MKIASRVCLLGLAIGNALGSHFEGQSADWVQMRYPTTQHLIDNPPEAPWHYTDDTQMAIGVAEALVQDQQIVEPSLCAAFVSNYAPSRGYGRGARVILEAMQEGQYLGIDGLPPHFMNSLEDDHKGRSFIRDLALRLANSRRSTLS